MCGFYLCGILHFFMKKKYGKIKNGGFFLTLGKLFKYMEKSKLFLLLNSLNKKEFSRLESFVKSPFHNKNEEAVKLFLLLQKVFPRLEGYKVQKAYLAKKIFGDGTIKNQEKLSSPIFHLTKCVEAYILWLELEKEKNDKDVLYLKAFLSRELDKLFFQKINGIKRENAKTKRIDTNYYMFQYILNSMLYRHPKTKKLSTNIDDTLEIKNHSLDLFYFSAKLNEQLIIYNRNTVVNEERELIFIDEIIKEVDNNPRFKNVPLLSIYNFLIKYLTKKNAFNLNDYLEIKHLIFEKVNTLGEIEKSNIFILFLQYVMPLADNGKINLLQELFDFYTFGIEHKILYDGKYILPFIFYNLVQVACELDKQGWVEDFIEKYSSQLPIEFQDNITLSSYAYLYCSLSNCDKALEYLREINYKKHYYFDLIVKTITIRCLYIQNDSAFLHNYLDTFYAYVRRHTEMSPALKKRIINYARIVSLLDKSRYSRNVKLEELIEKINQEKNIYFRSWLLKQVS